MLRCDVFATVVESLGAQLGVGHRTRSRYRQDLSGMNDVRITNLVGVCLPDLRPHHRIAIDLRFARYIPEAIAVLLPGPYGIGRPGSRSAMKSLDIASKIDNAVIE